MNDFKKDLKNKNFKRAYLFCGDEKYLRSHYEKRAAEAIVPGSELMDLTVSDGGLAPGALARAFETPPFTAEKRLTIFRDTGLFAAGKKDEADAAENYIAKVLAAAEAPLAVVIFSESRIDKRVKIYKIMEKSGGVAEFKTPSEKELIDWITGIANRNGCTIKPAAAAAVVRYAADMAALESETMKLVAYRVSGEITPDDVERLCVKSLDIKVFALISAIGAKNRAAAVNMYRGLIEEKESPLMILGLIARQFGIMLRVRELSAGGAGVGEMSEALGLRSFVTVEALRQTKLFTGDSLDNAFAECLETDYRIKTGRVAERLGVELMIIKYSAA